MLVIEREFDPAVKATQRQEYAPHLVKVFSEFGINLSESVISTPRSIKGSAGKQSCRVELDFADARKLLNAPSGCFRTKATFYVYTQNGFAPG